MKDELAYALITPYSLYKSRTGGIISRLLAHAQLDFVASRMYVFSDEFLDAYKKVFAHDGMDPNVVDAWLNYIDRTLRKDNPYGNVPRCMLMLFKGPDAVKHLKEEVIGSFTEQPLGDTVRGTYGDFIRDASGEVHYLEPAVFTGSVSDRNKLHLKLLADYALTDGGVVEGMIDYDEAPQTTLVMLKPDNFYKRSRRPGNIIDTFSRTGLRIVGAKLFGMTVAQGEEFYGPLRDIFTKKLRFMVENPARELLGEAFEYDVTDEDIETITDLFARRNAICEFNKVVEFMTGVNPDTIEDADKATASDAKCLALLYEGVDAIEKVRTVLGATNPAKAEPGTVRSDFGSDLMRNGAHASDSPENAVRERKIVGLAPESDAEGCDIQKIIYDYLAQ